MAAPTSTDTGLPVEVTFNGSNPIPVAVPVVTTDLASIDVKYVPTPGAADER